MPSLDTAPQNVRRWFAAREDAGPKTALFEVLASDVTLVFAGRKISGADAVVNHLTAMPSAPPGTVEWAVLPGADDTHITVRGTGAGGAPLPSPGGPMSAMDFAFTLNTAGMITQITPHPHHSEPLDLAKPLPIGSIAPMFTLPDVHGLAVPLRKNNTAATVVIFTCNPCPWALGWHDRLQRVARDYASSKVQVLQINANDPAVSAKDALEESRRRVDDGQFAGPYLVDEGQRVARGWGARHTPDVFVLDAAGTVVYHGAPDADVDDESLDAQWLRAALDALLAGSEPALSNTKPIGCTIKWTL